MYKISPAVLYAMWTIQHLVSLFLPISLTDSSAWHRRNAIINWNESEETCWIQQTYISSDYKRWHLYMCRVSFLIKEPFLPFILLSVLSTEFHIAVGKKQKHKHSSPCLIHWAATVNVQRGGKDNFSQGRLPGTTLDHRLPSSLFSLFWIKIQSKFTQ